MTTTPTITRSYARHSALQRLASRRPLTVFLLLGLSLGYTLAFAWGLAYHGVIPGGGLANALHIAPDELAGGVTLLALFPAALYVTWATDGREGVQTLLRRALNWRVNPGWWLAILLGLPTLTVGLAILLGDNLRPVDLTSLIVSQATLLLINFVVTNLWEETAWTGVFQTHLEEHHHWLVAAVLTAIPFAAAHLPLQFFLGQPVTPGSLAAAFGLYFVIGLLVRPLFAIYRRATGDSLLLVALLHSVFNRTANQNGIAATLVDGNARMLALLIAVVALTVVTAISVRPRPGRQHEASLAGQRGRRTDGRGVREPR
jgi:membrane protease YdiL (CAAX protease family)